MLICEISTTQKQQRKNVNISLSKKTEFIYRRLAFFYGNEMRTRRGSNGGKIIEIPTYVLLLRGFVCAFFSLKIILKISGFFEEKNIEMTSDKIFC